MNIIEKIKKAKLVGRGGASFPTARKWETFVQTQSQQKYIIANIAEGEPGVLKDAYILENNCEDFLDGLILATRFFKPTKTYLYLRHVYYKKYFKKITKILDSKIKSGKIRKNIELICEPQEAGYIGGAETVLLRIIEKKHIEPNLKPPFPTTCGLFGQPTLINNIETFLNIALVSRGEYKNERFYTIGGDCVHPGVYRYKDNFSILKILELTENYPDFPFFVQVGGDASGVVLSQKQLKQKVGGAGAITIHKLDAKNSKNFLINLLDFFINESCGKCTPCREGVYRMREIISEKKVNYKLFLDLIENLEQSAFCALGMALPVVVRSYLKNICKIKI